MGSVIVYFSAPFCALIEVWMKAKGRYEIFEQIWAKIEQYLYGQGKINLLKSTGFNLR